MNTQPEALRLADALDYYRDYDMSVTHTGIDEQAATELRRLHEENERLKAQQASGTEWLVCPKCAHTSPYTAVKAKTLAEEAEVITKRARAALAQMKPAPAAPTE